MKLTLSVKEDPTEPGRFMYEVLFKLRGLILWPTGAFGTREAAFSAGMDAALDWAREIAFR